MSEHGYYIRDKELFLMRFYHYFTISQMWIFASSWQKKTGDIEGFAIDLSEGGNVSKTELKKGTVNYVLEHGKAHVILGWTMK